MQSLHYKKQSHKIYFDNMSDILSIDEANKCVRVEPCITIGNLNDFLIQRGWMLPIVPELDDLTIGGVCFKICGVMSSVQFVPMRIANDEFYL